MTQTAHTPGPWQQFDNGGCTSDTRHCYGVEYSDVVWGPSGPGHGAIADCSPHGQPATDETRANARLVAAAPDMLEALKLCLEAFRHTDFSNGNTDPTGSIDEGRVFASRMMADIDALIAKATGAA